MRSRIVLSVLGCLLCASVSVAEKPNIVLILVDDLGYGDLSCFGAQDLKTPHIDELMAAGCGWISSTPTVRCARRHGLRC